MLRITGKALETLDEELPGIKKRILEIEIEVLPACIHCGCKDTAIVEVARRRDRFSKPTENSTTKYMQVDNGPKSGDYYCRPCHKFFDSELDIPQESGVSHITSRTSKKLLSLIAREHATCAIAYRTTFGEVSCFSNDLMELDLSSMEVAECLMQMHGYDVPEERDMKAWCFNETLNFLSPLERRLVLRHWMNRIKTDSRLALGVLLWTNYGTDTSLKDFGLILDAAAPELQSRKYILDDLRSGRHKLPDPLPPRVSAVFKIAEDEEMRQQDEENRKRDEEARRLRAREDYFLELSKIPFEHRVHAIVSIPSTKGRSGYGWGQYSDEEIDALDAQRTQTLINLCEKHGAWRDTEVLHKLYDKRRKLRQLEMDNVRQKYASMTHRDQLNELVNSTCVPIEHFPVELAIEVTDGWLSTLRDDSRDRFLSQLGACKLSVWSRAREGLSTQAPGDDVEV